MDLISRIRDDMAYESNIGKSYIYRFLMEFQLWLPIWVIYLREHRGFSLTQITLLDTPFFLLVVLAEVPTGAVADRFGRRISLMLGTAFFAVAVFVFGIADNYLIILVSYTAWGLALTFQSGADTALLYDSMKQVGKEDQFPSVNGRLWAVRSVAALLGLLIGARIAAATSYEFAIVASAVIGACAFPVAFSMKEPPTYRRGERPPDRESYFETLVSGVRDVWRRPPLRWICLYSGLVSMAAFVPLVYQQLFLEEHGVSLANLGWWQAPVRLAGIIAALLAGQILMRFGERGTFFAMPVVLGISALALAGIDTLAASAAFLGMGLVAGLQNPAVASYINHRIPSHRRATMLSVQNVAASLILAGAQPLGGIVADAFGLQAAMLMFGVIALGIGMLVVVLWDRAERAEVAAADDDWTLDDDGVVDADVDARERAVLDVRG